MYLVPGGYLVLGGVSGLGSVPGLGGVSGPGGGVPGPGGGVVYLVPGGVPGPWGCTWSRGDLPRYPPPRGQTHTCKNKTFATSLRTVIKWVLHNHYCEPLAPTSMLNMLGKIFIFRCMKKYYYCPPTKLQEGRSNVSNRVCPHSFFFLGGGGGSHVTLTHDYRSHFSSILTARNSSCGKVMFSQASVILSVVGGGNML